MTVLLNRPGRSASQPNGYEDTGLNITLSDSATTDIHLKNDRRVAKDAKWRKGEWFE